MWLSFLSPPMVLFVCPVVFVCPTEDLFSSTPCCLFPLNFLYMDSSVSIFLWDLKLFHTYCLPILRSTSPSPSWWFQHHVGDTSGVLSLPWGSFISVPFCHQCLLFPSPCAYSLGYSCFFNCMPVTVCISVTAGNIFYLLINTYAIECAINKCLLNEQMNKLTISRKTDAFHSTFALWVATSPHSQF